jgi:hypothetical protein
LFTLEMLLAVELIACGYWITFFGLDAELC